MKTPSPMENHQFSLVSRALVKVCVVASMCVIISLAVFCKQVGNETSQQTDTLSKRPMGMTISGNVVAAALSLDSVMLKEKGQPVQVVHTADYTVRIDRLSDGSYRYNSWKAGKDLTSTPYRVVGEGRYDLPTDSYYFHDRAHKITCIVGNPDFKGDDVYVIVRQGNTDVYYQKTFPLYEEPDTKRDVAFRLVRTKEHTVRIDKVSTGEYRYIAWKTGKQLTEQPDLLLESGIYDKTTRSFYFQTPNKAYTYIVGNPEGKERNLYIIVQHEGKTISQNPVLEVENGKATQSQGSAGDLKLVKTPEYIVRISRNAEGILLYTAWSTGGRITDKPTLELSNGRYDQTTDSYIFQNDTKTYTYIVGHPEKKSSGTYLVVKKGGKIIYNTECK